ncbi:ATP-binding cassette domain-containing protein [Ileibacterium valens]|uniref:ATP-binding cassette domain-containing protein n=1 Tax=Ileibacterium valens TaxID=1862668 RepID=UPI00272CDD51|nr:ATP-binding cassette domain-containing protein [Ileibacterium valens]
MFTCKNLSVTLASGRKLVENLTFSMSDHNHIGLIGEEGNGKSTLLKIFAGDQPDYVRITGFFYSDQKIGYLPQQFDEKWLDQEPLHYLLSEEPQKEIEISAWNRLSEIEKLAVQLKIDHDLIYRDQNISTLSGGEKVRLLFLKMMMNEPEIFLLDEPSNDLDLDALVWMENWIKNQSAPILFISHDIRLLNTCANKILHIELRNKKTKTLNTIYSGKYDEYLESRANLLNRQSRIASEEKREYLKKKQRLNDLHNKVESRLKTVSRQAPHEGKMLKRSMRSVLNAQDALENQSYSKTDSVEEGIGFILPERSFPSNKKLLDLEHFCLSVNGKLLISEFGLRLIGPVHLVITGKNGCGKTTLLRQIKEILKDTPGITVGYLPQNYEEVFKAVSTPAEYLEQFTENSVLARKALGSMKFTENELEQKISKCSGGQKVKMILASMAIRNCNVLLLDEPTRNLSPLSARVLSEELSRWNGAIIAISHDREFIQEVFTLKAVIEDQIFQIHSMDEKPD